MDEIDRKQLTLDVVDGFGQRVLQAIENEPAGKGLTRRDVVGLGIWLTMWGDRFRRLASTMPADSIEPAE